MPPTRNGFVIVLAALIVFLATMFVWAVFLGHKPGLGVVAIVAALGSGFALIFNVSISVAEGDVGLSNAAKQSARSGIIATTFVFLWLSYTRRPQGINLFTALLWWVIWLIIYLIRQSRSESI